MITSRPVVFVQFTLERSGSPISGLMVVDALREAGFHVHLAYHQSGGMLAQYRDRCVTVTQLDHGRWLAGGPWHRRFRRLLHDYRAARKFVALFRETQPALVYVNNLTGLSAALAARRLRIPCIWHIRELLDDVGGEMHAPWPGGKRLVRLLAGRLPRQIVAISRAVAENVLGRCDHPKLVVIPNAVGDEFFACNLSRDEARARLGLPGEVPIVGVPGTLRPVKGHPFFLEAFSRVLRQVPTCLAVLTGDGEAGYQAELHAFIRSRKLEEHVRFLGTVEDMPAFYRSCDVVCVPSRSEPFGRTVIEAFACGRPVVATAVGGIRETVEHGKSGLLVSYGDVDSLASAVVAVLTDRSFAARLATAARCKAEREYGAEVYWNAVLSAIKSVVY